MTEIVRSPARTGSIVALLAALLALALGGIFSAVALAIGLIGVLIVALGLALARHDIVTVGSTLLFGGVVAAGLQGAPPGITLGGTVVTVVAWDSASTAIDLGAQLGREASTTRLELVHSGATAFVGTVTAGLGWALFQIPLGETSLTVPVLLLVAVICLAGTFWYRE